MKTLPRLFFVPIQLLSLVLLVPVASGQLTLLDDTWSDGDRTDTALPDEAAWFASNAGSDPTLSASPGRLTGHVRMFETNTSSRLWITHFTAAGTPVELADGDTLKLSLSFRPVNVNTASSTSRGLRIGLFNFSEPGAARVTADGFSTGGNVGAPGANVTGYMLNQNFSERVTVNNPVQIMKRTDVPNVNLMGASGVYTTLSSGGGGADAPAFQNNVLYLFEFSVKRIGETAEITCRFSDDAGWSLQHTVVDSSSANFRFDGLGFRPNSVADTADEFHFSRCRAEHIPFQVRVLSLEYPTLTGARVTWAALPGKTYQVEWRPSFGSESPWTVLTTVTADASVESYDDPDAFFVPEGFYRVVQLL